MCIKLNSKFATILSCCLKTNITLLGYIRGKLIKLIQSLLLVVTKMF